MCGRILVHLRSWFPFPFLCPESQVTCKQLVGAYLSIWARKRLARHIRGVQATTAGTGFGGYLGNKGAVAVRMRVYDAALVVVCSHLASGDQEGDDIKRHNDVAEINKRCIFIPTDPSAGTIEVCCMGDDCILVCIFLPPELHEQSKLSYEISW